MTRGVRPGRDLSADGGHPRIGLARRRPRRRSTCPTVVVHGDADPLVDISGGRRTAELVPGAEFRLMEGMGHDLPPSYWDGVRRRPFARPQPRALD